MWCRTHSFKSCRSTFSSSSPPSPQMTTRPAVPTAAAHIHEGEAGVAGDIVVTLEAQQRSRGRASAWRPDVRSRWYGRGGGPKLGPRPSLRSELRTFLTPFASASAIRSSAACWTASVQALTNCSCRTGTPMELARAGRPREDHYELADARVVHRFCGQGSMSSVPRSRFTTQTEEDP